MNTSNASSSGSESGPSVRPDFPFRFVLEARGLTKKFGRVVALDEAHFELRRGEILGVIGDNGAGKSSLIKVLTGALRPDRGEIFLEGRLVSFSSPIESRLAGIETVYQNLALSPALSIVDNMFMGRELRRLGLAGRYFRFLDRSRMRDMAQEKLKELGILTVQALEQAVETLSGGQRQAVAIARATLFSPKIIIMDEPTAALGVRESSRVLDLIQSVKARGISVVLISHNMPHVFEVADRVHIHRLGHRMMLSEVSAYSMAESVAFMTGASRPAAAAVPPARASSA